ncbi:MAG: peroxiredoxin [Alphaproteobacteria bacterium]|nr:peroxiredoxin [Alphaproteobacteria bacterium]
MENVVELTPKSTPRLNAPAPDFEADSTQGMIRLSDYLSKWVLLFSHPADFTPVCTTEFVALAHISPEMKKRNVQLLGLSIDSTFSHIAWLRNIHDKFGVDIDFPIIADLNKKVASLYGMTSPYESETATTRCVFFIDDKGLLRAMLYYPMTLGRNIDELLRVIDGLQMVDKNSVSLPANWHPGEKVIVPPPKTMEAAELRIKEGYECTDWYYCKKAV